jgi:hypothetical protein
MVEQVLGRWLNDVLKHWLDFPTHHGEIYDIGIWHFLMNARMH